MMKRIILSVCITIALSSTSALAQVNVGEDATIKGTVFGDFYYISNNHNPDLKGNNGFWLRRIYFTYEHRISDRFSSRLRLEMSSPGDFITDTKLEPAVKDAYLKWSKNSQSIYAGISSTPTWGLVEDLWGYRAVEKSPLDLQKMGSSRDLGLSIKGKLGTGEKFGYHFMFGNGNSNKSELNKGKKFMLSLSYRLTEHIIIQGYGDFNDQPVDRDTYTGQAVAGYRSPSFNFGALYAYQFRDHLLSGGEQHLDLFSVFANMNITESLKGYLRVDHLFDPNPGGSDIDYLPLDEQAENTVIIGGVDIELDPGVHLMPNLEAVIYGETPAGTTPDTDLVPRVTLMYTF